jgi:hypothetical protein
MVRDINGFELVPDGSVNGNSGLICDVLRATEISGRKGCFGITTKQCLSNSDCMIYPNEEQSDGWCGPIDSHSRMRQYMVLGLGITAIIAVVSAIVIALVKLSASMTERTKKVIRR